MSVFSLFKHRFIFFAFLFLFGCTTASIKPMFFELENVKVNVYSLHPESNSFGPGFGRIIGTSGGGKITVEGYLYKGKLIFSSPGALGHEMIHLLNEKYSNLVWNPDKIGED